MGKLFGGAPKGPSAAELQAREEAARERERQRIAAEETKKKQEAEAAMADKERARQAFIGGIADEEGQESRKRFLKGA